MRCRYIRKIFQNEENGYTIAVFSTQDNSVPLSARDKFWTAKKVIALVMTFLFPMKLKWRWKETGNLLPMDFSIRWKPLWRLCQEQRRGS